jgi:Fe2+ or Zn2+ uptake regulation protein
MPADLHNAVASALAGVGQRYTASRRLIVDALAQAAGPLSIVDVLAAQPALPQSSVYRNLTALEAAGVARRIVVGDYHHYELSESYTGHHHHLVCAGCGAVTDVVLRPGAERAIDRLVEEAVRGTGFRPEGHRLDILGECGRCAGAASGRR